MKTTARSDSDKAQVKQKILTEARKIVVREGFGGLGIRKLAARVGYAPGNIYLYFAGRDDIARAICRQGFAELLAAIQPAAKLAKPLARLKALLTAYSEFALRHPETYKLIFMQDPQFNEEIFRQTAIDEQDGAGETALGLIVTALEELKGAGKIKKKADTTQLAEVLWAGVHGVVSLKLIYPVFPTTRTDVLIETMIQTLLNGVCIE